jgi:hypothetical protein
MKEFAGHDQITIVTNMIRTCVGITAIARVMAKSGRATSSPNLGTRSDKFFSTPISSEFPKFNRRFSFHHAPNLSLKRDSLCPLKLGLQRNSRLYSCSFLIVAQFVGAVSSYEIPNEELE